MRLRKPQKTSRKVRETVAALCRRSRFRPPSCINNTVGPPSCINIVGPPTSINSVPLSFLLFLSYGYIHSILFHIFERRCFFLYLNAFFLYLNVRQILFESNFIKFISKNFRSGHQMGFQICTPTSNLFFIFGISIS